MECKDGTTWIRTGCILTYGGSVNDIILNYFILVVNVAYCTVRLWNHNRKHIAFYCLLGVITFQWSLCLALGCSGVSIVWGTICGWIMQQRRHQESLRHETPVSPSSERFQFFARLEEWGKGVVLLNLLVIVYYAIVLEAITTVAHVCALILGAILHSWFVRDVDRSIHVDVAAPLLQQSIQTDTASDQNTM